MKIDVIGPGYEGNRLICAFEHSSAQHGEDLDVHTYSRADISQMPVDPAGIRETFDGTDVIINATSDDQHLGVLNLLQHTDAFVLSEKPLIAPSEDVPASWRQAWEGSEKFALNCIERYSPMVDYVLAQIRQRGLRIARIDFTWAKNRFDDPRPTIGIVSEIIHPIDLCCYFTGTDPETVRLHQVSVIVSDFTSFTDKTPETAQITAEMNGTIVTGYSSFAHPDRKRAFDITLVGADGLREYIQLTFDEPNWDRDLLRHWSATGTAITTETTYNTGGETVPKTCGKLSVFAEDIITGTHGRRYTTFSEAVGLHHLLARIQKVAGEGLELTYGRGCRRTTLDRSDTERLG